MFFTSNERDSFSLYADIFDSENKHKSYKLYMKMCFFYFYFLIVHISSNNVLGSLRLCMHVGNTHVEGTVSQIFSLYLSFYFMSKNG